MANYATLKAAIADVVKTNGSQAITGDNLQQVLLSVVNSIGSGYLFMGVATPSTSVGTPDQNVFYITGAGTFANMGSTVTIPVGSIGVFRYNGSWSSSQLKIFDGIDSEPYIGSTKLVSSDGILNTILNSNYNIKERRSATFINADGNIQYASGSKWETFIYSISSSKVRVVGSPSTADTYKGCAVYADASYSTLIASYDIPNAGYIDINIPQYGVYLAVCYHTTNHQKIFVHEQTPIGKYLEQMEEKLENGGYVELQGKAIDSSGDIVTEADRKVILIKPFCGKVEVTINARHLRGYIFCAFYNGEPSAETAIKVVETTGDLQANSTVVVSIPKNATVIGFNDDVNFKCIGNASTEDYVSQDVAQANNGVALDIVGFITLQGSTYSVSGWRCSDYVECYQGDTLCVDLLSAENATTIGYYDKDKNFIASGSVQNVSAFGIIQVPNNPNICYVRFCCYLQRIEEIGSACIVHGGRSKMNVLRTIVGRPFDFNEKKALFVGDSITKGYINASYTTPDPYCKLFCDAVGMTLVNNAVSGSTFSSVGTPKSIPTQFAESDLSDIDFVFIAGGTNDHALGATLSQFRTAVKDMFDDVVTDFATEHPNSVFIITPINKTRYDAAIIEPLDEYRFILTEEALMHQFNIINGADAGFPDVEGALARYMFAIRADSALDYIHPSEDGHKIYAKFMQKVLA